MYNKKAIEYVILYTKNNEEGYIKEDDVLFECVELKEATVFKELSEAKLRVAKLLRHIDQTLSREDKELIESVKVVEKK